MLSFSYSMFFSDKVPCFWDCQQLYQGYHEQNMTVIAGQFFSIGSNSISDGPRPIQALFFKTIFYLWGYDITIWRAIKAVIFALVVVLVFNISYRHIKDYLSALLLSLFVMCSYSIYMANIQHDVPYIIAEMFKLAAFYLFLKDFHEKKTSVSRQIAIIVAGLLAIRTYQEAYSIPVTLAAYIVFSRFRNIKRYAVMLVVLFATNFPMKIFSLFDFGRKAEFHLNFIQMKRILFNGASDYILTPVLNLKDLYYKPLIAVITFFGFWLFIIVLLIYLMRKKLVVVLPRYMKKEKVHVSHKSIVLFLIAWIMGGIPSWLYIPDSGVRYTGAVLIPLLMLLFVMISKVLALFNDKYRKIIVIIVAVFVLLACLTNIAYTTSHRAGWGSAFIGMEKTTNYIEHIRSENSIILYYSDSVAEEYLPMNISRPTSGSQGVYEYIRNSVKYRQTKSIDEFSAENLMGLSRNYSEVYVIKRITGINKNEYPKIDFDSNPHLIKLKTIKGVSNSLFDQMMYLANETLKIGYEPQTFYVYKYSGSNIKSS